MFMCEVAPHEMSDNLTVIDGAPLEWKTGQYAFFSFSRLPTGAFLVWSNQKTSCPLAGSRCGPFWHVILSAS